jgi:hypothetical protein
MLASLPLASVKVMPHFVMPKLTRPEKSGQSKTLKV